MGRVFTALLLFVYLVGGVSLAHGGGGLLQAELGEPLGGHLAREPGDGLCLAGVALVGGLQALAGEIRTGLGGGDALLLRPDE